MLNYFCKFPLWEANRGLTAVALGKEPADLVIRDARLVDVCTGEILEHTDVAVARGRVALVGDAAHCVGDKTRVIDAKGGLIAPGFLDGHMHVESSMLSVGEYARAVIPHGTVGVYMDPHEICNVLGVRGVKLMIEDGRRVPLKLMVTAPSCVPALPGLEDSGAAIGAEDIREMMTWPEVVGLGEMMNYPGIFALDEGPFSEIAETLKADKVVTGHYSEQETGKGLNAYIASGACCCHESTRAEDALAKMRLGMYAQIREGSAWQDLHDLAPVVASGKIDTRFANLVSDDMHPNTLYTQGHIDHILRRALEEGIDPIAAIQMVTINPAACFRMEHELGSITPGKCADIVFLESLETMRVTRVIIDGQVVAEDGKYLPPLPAFSYPAWATDTVHVGADITAESFQIPAPKRSGTAKIRVIEIIPARANNRAQEAELPIVEGRLESDLKQDLLKTFVIERHRGTGTWGRGFVKGFGLKGGALAQTVAHDAHNLIVVGTNDDDMALAANTVIGSGGGLCAALDGKVLGHVPLPIAGLMNDRPVEEMSALVETLERAWETMGCTCPSPFMTMALISLACIPELRLTNQGLVDCRTYEKVGLILEE